MYANTNILFSYIFKLLIHLYKNFYEKGYMADFVAFAPNRLYFRMNIKDAVGYSFTKKKNLSLL